MAISRMPIPGAFNCLRQFRFLDRFERVSLEKLEARFISAFVTMCLTGNTGTTTGERIIVLPYPFSRDAEGWPQTEITVTQSHIRD